jgi:hypothetical protein
MYTATSYGKTGTINPFILSVTSLLHTFIPCCSRKSAQGYWMKQKRLYRKYVNGI